MHVNIHLIEADSPEMAFEKALALGLAGENRYANTDGEEVRITFRGLRDLGVIHEELEDGAELRYEAAFDVPEEELLRKVRLRHELGVFAPIDSTSEATNCMPEEVMRMIEAAGFRREEVMGNLDGA